MDIFQKLSSVAVSCDWISGRAGKLYLLLTIVLFLGREIVIKEISIVVQMMRSKVKKRWYRLFVVSLLLAVLYCGFKSSDDFTRILRAGGSTLSDIDPLKVESIKVQRTGSWLNGPQIAAPVNVLSGTNDHTSHYSLGVNFPAELKVTFAVYISHLRSCLENKGRIPLFPFLWSDWYQTDIDLHDLKPPIAGNRFVESQIDLAAKGRNYMSSNSYVVNQIIFMNHESDINYIVKTEMKSTERSFTQFLRLVHDLVNQTATIYSIRQELNSINHLIGHQSNQLFPKKIETRSNSNYTSFDDNHLFINLEKSDFELPFSHIDDLDIESLSNNNENLRRFLKNLHFVERKSESQFGKFFHEVHLQDDQFLAGSHYDWRFFKKVIHGQEKYFALHHLIRTWQEFANKEKIIYWLSHGNLLAWRWSGNSFAWDNDCDIQLPIKHLEYLAINFNGSLIIEDPSSGYNRYLIEINPYFVDRVNVNGNNAIDGRIIDLATGLYIDLTALSVDEYNKQVISDKHIHNYSLSSLTPLRSTLYEGSLSWIPHDTDYILTKEYPTGLVDTQYNEYTYLPSFNFWMKNFQQCAVPILGIPGSYNLPLQPLEHCNNFDPSQVSYLFDIWNLKQVENDFACYNKLFCRLPLSISQAEALVPSPTRGTRSNNEEWKLTNFASEGLKKIVNSWKIPVLPNSDLSIL